MAEWIDMTGKGRVTPRLEQVVTAFVEHPSITNHMRFAPVNG